MDTLLCSLTNHDTKCQLDKAVLHLYSYYFKNTPVIHRPVEELLEIIQHKREERVTDSVNYCSTSVDKKEVNDKAGAVLEVADDNADVGTQVGDDNADVGTQVGDDNADVGTQVGEENADVGNEVGDGLGMWRVWVRRGWNIGSLWGNRREREHWGNLGVDG